MKEENIRLLKRIMSYMPNHSGCEVVHAVYISPAQRLRDSADRIEQQEKDLAAFDEYIRSLDEKTHD